MKIRVRRFPLLRAHDALLICGVFAALSPPSFAQDAFDDSIEAELDSLSAPEDPSASTAAPPASQSAAKPAEKAATPPATKAAAKDVPVEDELSFDGLESDPAPVAKPSEEKDIDQEFSEMVTEEKQAMAPEEVPAKPEPAEAEVAKPEIVAPEPKPEAPVASPPVETLVSEVPRKDEPDLAFEARLARISKEIERPMDEMHWLTMIAPQGGDPYTITKGDTLWDLSKTLFGDGTFWSKLWSENPELGNPHELTPRMAIRFIQGSAAGGPRIELLQVQKDGEGKMSVVRKEDTNEANPETESEAPIYKEDVAELLVKGELDRSSVLEEAEIIDRPRIPDPAVPAKPLIPIPSSFLPPPSIFTDVVAVEVKQDKGKARTEPAQVIPGFLATEEEPDDRIEIESTERGGQVATSGERVLLKVKPGISLSPKERLSILGSRFKLEAPGRFRSVGYALEVEGILSVIDQVNEESFRAEVIHAVNPVRLGAKALRVAVPHVRVVKDGRFNAGQATVVGGEYRENRKHMGEGTALFLHGAKGADIQVGDIMAIQGAPESEMDPAVPFFSSALVRVFHVDGDLASALVVESHRPVVTGDLTGPRRPQNRGSIRVESAVLGSSAGASPAAAKRY